jgi:hypothetical protein
MYVVPYSHVSKSRYILKGSLGGGCFIYHVTCLYVVGLQVALYFKYLKVYLNLKI